MSELQKYLKENKNWTELTQPPFSLLAKESEDYVLFKYSQINSDFSLKIVREARGIIFEKKTWRIVRRAFDKFFNIQEPFASKIDFKTAKIQQKIDGSLISIWYDKNVWNVSTNGNIFAEEAKTGYMNLSFKDIFLMALKRYQHLYKDFLLSTNKYLNENFCYTFELVSPFTRIVIPYNEVDIYLTCVYDLKNQKEIDPEEIISDIWPKTPKCYNFNSIEEVISKASELPFTEEGYVIVDKHFNRVKVKSPAYIRAHYTKNNGVINEKIALEMIRIGEDKEFLSIYPEYSRLFDTVRKKYNDVVKELEEEFELFQKIDFKDNRKEFAKWALTKTFSDFLFGLLDNKYKTPHQYLERLSEEKILNTKFKPKFNIIKP